MAPPLKHKTHLYHLRKILGTLSSLCFGSTWPHRDSSVFRQNDQRRRHTDSKQQSPHDQKEKMERQVGFACIMKYLCPLFVCLFVCLLCVYNKKEWQAYAYVRCIINAFLMDQSMVLSWGKMASIGRSGVMGQSRIWVNQWLSVSKGN